MQEDILQCKINNTLRTIPAPSHDTSYAHTGWRKEKTFVISANDLW